jgi:DnaJ-class molecular chaperone
MGGIVFDIMQVFGLTSASAEQVQKIEQLLQDHVAAEMRRTANGKLCLACHGSGQIESGQGSGEFPLYNRCQQCDGTGVRR